MIDTQHHSEDLNPFSFISTDSIIGMIKNLVRKAVWILLFGAIMAGMILFMGLKPQAYKAETVIRVHQIPPSDEYYSEHVSLEAEMEVLKSISLVEEALAPLQRDVTIIPIIGKKEALQEVMRLGRGKLSGEKAAESGRVNVGYFKVNPVLHGSSFTLRYVDENRFLLRNTSGDVDIAGSVGEAIVHPMVECKIEAIFAEPGQQFAVKSYTPYDMARHMQHKLKVMRVGLENFSGLIKVHMEYPDKDLVHRFLQHYITAYKDRTFDRITREIRVRVAQLEGDIDRLNQEVAEDTQRMEEIEQKYTSIDHESESNLLLKNLLDFERRYLEVNSSLQQMQNSFTDKHPSIVSMKKQKKILQGKIADLKKKIERIPAIHKEKFEIQHRIEKAKESITIIMEDLVRLTSRLESTKNYISIIHEPRTVHLPYLSSLLRNIITGFIFGCLLAAFVFTLREASFIKKVRHVKDVEALTHVPVMGEMFGRVSAKHHGQISDLAANLSFLQQAYAKGSVSMLHYQTQTAQTVLTLAKEMASNQRVLLVDLDTKHQHLTKAALHGTHAAGISEIAIGQAQPNEVIQSIEERLYLIPAGLGMRNYEVLRHVGALQDMLQSLGDGYDHIILNMPDMAHAPAHVDGLLQLTENHLLCVQSKQSCSRVIHVLKSFEQHIKGVILCHAK